MYFWEKFYLHLQKFQIQSHFLRLVWEVLTFQQKNSFDNVKKIVKFKTFET